MNANKKRDIAKDFADFLQSETKQKASSGNAVSAKAEIKSAALPMTQSTSASAVYQLPSNSSSIKQVTPPAQVVEVAQVVKAAATPIRVPAQKPGLAPQSISAMSSANQAVGKSALLENVSNFVGSSEALRVAQVRILELEKERDDLRNDVSELLLTSESLQKTTNELKTQLENAEHKQKQKIEILEEEKIVHQERLKAKEKELIEVRSKLDEIDLRFREELKKIRNRERDYESKNIIIKAESVAVFRAKDEMLMDLRRKLDQLQFEIDNYKSQTTKSNSIMDEWRERHARTVKALRLALSIMEGGEKDE